MRPENCAGVAHESPSREYDYLIERMVARGDLRLAFRISKAAKLVDVGRSKFYELVNKGAIPVVIIGGQRRVTLAALLDLLGQEARR